jgi:hypothetical protein
MIQLNGSMLGSMYVIITVFFIIYTNIHQMEKFQNKDTEDNK